MLLLALGFFKSYWKIIVPVVLLLMALGYVKILHMEINHYKSKVVALEQEKAIVAEKNALLETAALDLTKKYSRQLENNLLEQQKKAQQVQERIKKDEETKRIALSSNVVELFNASKPDTQTAPATKPEDVRKTSTTGTTTLNDLLSVSARNDANHVVCIETVAEWQNFWKDFEAGVKAVGGN